MLPLTVSGELAAGVVAKVVTVIVEVPPAVTGLLLKDAVAPPGRPLTLKVTDDAEPEVTLVATV